MRFWHKVVSIGVLAIVVTLPFLSLAMCVPENPGSMQCPPDCPMMADMSPGHSGMEMSFSNAPASCCQFKSSHPGPVTESKTVAPTLSIEPSAIALSYGKIWQVRRASIVASSPPVAPASQAQLCTFLI